MDQKTYNLLLSKAKNTKSSKHTNWYEITERLLIKQTIRCTDDLVRLVAFAYSWMPTIPKWPEPSESLDKKLNKLVQEIIAMEKVIQADSQPDKEQIIEIMRCLVPIANNSITGASKVLYFVFPDTFPILDSNIIKGWRKLFQDKGTYDFVSSSGVVKLPSKLGGAKSMNTHIAYYADYVINMHTWKNNLNTNISIRNIEKTIYLLGKQQK